MDSLKLSILTPSYNSAKHLQRAINSVLAQDYTNWEHIIVDGGSTDETTQILKSHPHIKWISEPDKGQSDAMNKAFEMSTGDIIVYLNADDEFLPKAFQEVIEAFNENKEADAVIGNLYFEDSTRKIYKKPKLLLDDILHYQYYKFPANPVSYFYKRHVQNKIGPFPIGNHYTMDYWFLLRLYHRFQLHYIDKPLGIFYGTGENKSSDKLRALKSLHREKISFIFRHGLWKYYPVAFLDLFRFPK